MKVKLSFCFRSLCGSAALLFQNLIQDNSEGRNGSEERAENLRNERVLGRQLAEGHELVNRQNLTFNHAALDLDDVLVLLGKFANDASRSDGVFRGGRHGRRAVEKFVELGVASLVGGETGQRVLHDRIFDIRSTELRSLTLPS